MRGAGHKKSLLGDRYQETLLKMMKLYNFPSSGKLVKIKPTKYMSEICMNLGTTAPE